MNKVYIIILALLSFIIFLYSDLVGDNLNLIGEQREYIDALLARNNVVVRDTVYVERERVKVVEKLVPVVQHRVVRDTVKVVVRDTVRIVQRVTRTDTLVKFKPVVKRVVTLVNKEDYETLSDYQDALIREQFGQYGIKGPLTDKQLMALYNWQAEHHLWFNHNHKRFLLQVTGRQR